MSQDDEIESINKRKLDEMKKQNELRASQASTEPVVLTDSTFASEVTKRPLVVVDFWAAWCGPCRMVAPIVEQLAKEYAGRVTFGKLNVDENPEVSQRFGIQSIPTMIVFKNGQPVDGLIGALPKTQIENKFKPYL